MRRLTKAALLGALMTSLGGMAASAADLDYEYAPPPPRSYEPPPPSAYAPPVAYAPRVVEEPPLAVYPQPYVYRRPYLYPGPYVYSRRVPPPFYGPYRRFAYGPRYRAGDGPGLYR